MEICTKSIQIYSENFVQYIYIYIIQYKIKYMCTLIIEYYNINNNYKY